MLFYRGRRFDYEVIEQEVIDRFEVGVLTREYEFPTLTLQTCDPLGQEINRRIIIAWLTGVYNRQRISAMATSKCSARARVHPKAERPSQTLGPSHPRLKILTHTNHRIIQPIVVGIVCG